MLKKSRAQRNAYAIIVYLEGKGSGEIPVCPRRVLPKLLTEDPL